MNGLRQGQGIRARSHVGWLPRLSLLLSALVFGAFGLVLFLFPGLLGTAGVEATGADGVIELRAFYGGLEIGMALFFLLAQWRTGWVRPALVAQVLSLGGVAVARALALLLAGGGATLMYLLLLAEAFGAAFGLAALRSMRMPRRRGRRAARSAASTALLLFLVAGAADAQEADSSRLADTWEGAAHSPAGLLEMRLQLALDEGWSGTFAIPAELVEVPVSEVRFRDDSVVVPLAPGRELRLHAAGDSLTGGLYIQGNAMPVVFGRSGSATAARIRSELESGGDRVNETPLEPTSSGAAAVAVDDAALERLIDAANAAHSDALVVLHDGELVGAWHSAGERQKLELMSATKSVLNLAVGRLLTTGALDSIDQPVHEFFPEWRDGPKSGITIRHLLAHTSGLASPMPTTPIYESDDFVRFALDAELLAPPGTEFRYNNNAANLLAGVLSRAAGERLDRFLGRDLFAALGIDEFGWSLDEAGNPHGMAGLQMYAEDVARLGQLVLQRGSWDGQRLIDAAWFEESLRAGSDLNPGAGLLWWLMREDGEVVGYRAEGYLGQYLVIYPDQGLVGVRQVAGSPDYDPQRDGFRTFQSLLRELAPAGE